MGWVDCTNRPRCPRQCQEARAVYHLAVLGAVLACPAVLAAAALGSESVSEAWSEAQWVSLASVSVSVSEA